MLETTLKYDKINAGPSSLRRRVMQLLLSGIRRWDRWQNLDNQEAAYHLTTLEMYPLGSLGRELSKVMTNTGQQTLRSSNMHEQLLHLFFPVFNAPHISAAIPFVLLGNGRIQKRSLVLSCCSWLFYTEDRAFYQSAFEFGKSLNKFTHWDIRHLLREPSVVIQAMINKESVGESEAPLW